MPVIVKDETATGDVLRTFTLDDLNEELSLREIIRARIYQEVTDFNQANREIFHGLVQPTDTEATLNGYEFKKARRQIDWEKQFEKALKAFDTNGFFVLVGDKQAESLDQRFDVSVDTEVSFVKLVPLVGG